MHRTNVYSEQKVLFEQDMCYITSLKVYQRRDEFLNLTKLRKRNCIFPKNFLKRWLADENKRQYIRIGMYPGRRQCPIDELNAWRPLALATVRPYQRDMKGLQYVLQFMDIMCRNNKAHVQALHLWIGQLVQQPHDRATTFCPVFTEVGHSYCKNALLALLTKLVEGNTVHGESFRRFKGKPNGLMGSAYVVNLRLN